MTSNDAQTSRDSSPVISKRRPRFWRARNIRRITQSVFLLFFIYLIWGGCGTPQISGGWELAAMPGPQILFLADPLAWFSAAISSRSILVHLPILSGIFIILTLILGRVFCGWVCPLGTIIDMTGRYLRPTRLELRDARARREQRAKHMTAPLFSSHVKYYLLVFLLTLAALGANLAGWFDPLAILMRATAFAITPSADWAIQQTLGHVSGESALGAAFAPTYHWLRAHIMNPVAQAYGQSFLHLGILALILALSRLRRRYWCNVLCPLGAFYGLLSRFALCKRRVRTSQCAECAVCGHICRMEAVQPGQAFIADPGECLRCMECGDACPRGGIDMTARAIQEDAQHARAPYSITRRGMLGAVGASITTLPLLRMKGLGQADGSEESLPFKASEFLLRPPGAAREGLFLRLCLRCGTCFKVCPQNALQPALLQSGLEGLWSPVVVPRIGYCEPSCTLCTQNCPSHALQALEKDGKRIRGRLGTAWVDRNRCLSWSADQECGVCEEMCPVSPKAIEMRNTNGNAGRVGKMISAPHIAADRCIGCGICENKCPVDGAAAIRVTRIGESRHAA
ncbi:MAG: 4Fe-4S binding protein [Candidatus Sumerlaeota bacterium]|nr:4Fe-4S binding protein [Candidatus Sumerlaeota bacterium]